jgi:hypothetical protein
MYVSGLLRCIGKKSIRQIANEVPGGYSDQSLQQFVNQSNWDPAPVRERLASQVTGIAAPTAWLVDEVAFHKHGRHSVGVERQYVRAHGRLSNCQLGVFVALCVPGAVVPVTWRLALPRSWDSDEVRRRKARIPPEERHQPYWRYQVEALDDLCGDWGVPLAPVLIDMRQSTPIPQVMSELEARGLDFMMRVSESVPIRHHSGRPRHPPGAAERGAPGRPAETTLADVSAMLSALPRKTLSWCDPVTRREKRAQFTLAPVHMQPPGGGAAPRPRVLLLEWGLGKPKPRALWLSNMVDQDLDKLVSVTRLSHQADVDLTTMTDQFGLCDYEGRSFLGWHHHVTLVSVAHAFHISQRRNLAGTESPTAATTPQASASCPAPHPREEYRP